MGVLHPPTVLSLGRFRKNYQAFDALMSGIPQSGNEVVKYVHIPVYTIL